MDSQLSSSDRTGVFGELDFDIDNPKSAISGLDSDLSAAQDRYREYSDQDSDHLVSSGSTNTGLAAYTDELIDQLGSDTATYTSKSFYRPERKLASIPEAFDPFETEAPKIEVLPLIRVVPGDANFYTTDMDYVELVRYLKEIGRKTAYLPREKTGFFRFMTRQEFTEARISKQPSRYREIMKLVGALADIRRDVRPAVVGAILERFQNRRSIGEVVELQDQQTKVRKIDQFGRAFGRGTRKSSRAVVWIAKGDGKVIVNGKLLIEHFNRIQDRKIVVNPLRVAGQVMNYNIFAKVEGGGATGQAGAVSLAIARALYTYNPNLGKILHDSNCLRQDLRVVERKKPGLRKARRAPQWVKR
ncbi:mitochondrial 37S ribosomal protein uS9m [Lipomyces oligophaga]|uniref:mitochondrial 37S ribosomal protein uS9m n=1 Tax=Lipomyces oligophaga TaxID=45792 RepID=UPI0034CD5DCD